MVNSNIHTYPLPFPSGTQRMQITSYSSLANALGTGPGYANQQKPRTRCDAVPDTRSIYADGPPVSNPLYPYPARNVLNPGTYLARTSSHVPNGRSPSNTNVVWSENNDQKDPPRFPSRYDRLPRPYFIEPVKPHGCQAGVEYPAIQFSRARGKEPYSLWDLLTMDTMPDLVAGNSPVFVHSPDRWIKIKFMWPGYPHYAFEKRIPIKRDTPFTPSLLLIMLACHVEEFVKRIHNERAVIEPGQEHWTITGATGDAPAMWKRCVITSLEHRTGSIWQPVIYYPRE